MAVGLFRFGLQALQPQTKGLCTLANCTFIIFLLLFLPFLVRAEIELPTLVREGTAGEVLQFDPVLPTQSGTTNRNSGTGSILNSIQNQFSIPASNYGRPGSLSQIRGLGMSSEDVDVQAFGISLNSPQGGGYDLSIFPQFLWSKFSYQTGPSLNGLNPMSTAGVLSLTPWTADALFGAQTQFEAGDFYSTAGLNQLHAAGAHGHEIAWVAGYSSFSARGPSAGMSWNWKRSSTYSGTVHVLATDIDAEAQGSIDSPTPFARMRTARVLPVFQNDFRFSESVSLRSSLFVDGARITYCDPGSGSESADNAYQWGLTNAFKFQEWKLGLSLRQVDYFGSNFSAPLQSIGNLQLSRIFGVESLLIEPTLQGLWVTGYGLMPQGSLGIRQEWEQGRKAVFVRAGVSHKVPSLMDRYFSFGQFIGNPDLKTEENWTAIVGTQLNFGRLDGSLQAYGQYRQNVRVLLDPTIAQPIFTVTNLGSASIFALQNSLQLKVTQPWVLYHSLSLATSTILVTGYPFPYIPTILGLLGTKYSLKLGGVQTQWNAGLRFSSSYGIRADSGRTLPGYAVLDAGVEIPIFKRLSLSLRMENVFDQTIEYVAGFPTGRIFSFLLSGGI